jgi:RNA recognition motif-containing protein
MDMTAKLLFSNVPFDCSDDLLSRWIEARGYSVLNVKLIRDVVSGTSPCFAHVQLANTTKLEDATRELDGQTLHGRKVHVRRLSQVHAKAASR